MESLQESQNWQELLAGYVLGDLNPQEEAQVKQYLSEHPEAEREILALEQSLALLPFALPEAAPPESLKSNLLAQVEADIAQEAASSLPQIGQVERVFQPHRSPKFGRLIAAAIAIVAVGLGGYSWSLQRKLAIAQQDLDAYHKAIAMLRQPDNRLLALQGMKNLEGATGSFVITPGMEAAVLSVQNLEQLPPGMVYSMWAYVDGKKVDCVEFRPGQDGKVFMTVPLDRVLTNTQLVEVTVEKAGTLKPSGEMVMKGDLSV
ncbi:Anti-sigma-K factor RskA [Thalassoporum mexicanum PCC 7367]|uniref:anti-sigma factor n=1 Tax=Thalassoporum mexicanum TaxID=3457544 RepID=UPI00029FD59B|nr:anti-sigma factor [Pseudanabaena sp. PCC 7367]AFY69050.1 Anti-sigma-K factor RskA [Pseudanabaena sp. PCC 7367]